MAPEKADGVFKATVTSRPTREGSAVYVPGPEIRSTSRPPQPRRYSEYGEIHSNRRAWVARLALTLLAVGVPNAGMGVKYHVENDIPTTLPGYSPVLFLVRGFFTFYEVKGKVL